MVKIRLRRIGTKARPFYRVVVTPSTAARNGRFVETLGTYDPVHKPVEVKIDEERAMHWLMNGAQPTATAAHLLSKIGVLDRYFEQRPGAKKKFGFLDKRTEAMSVKSVIEPSPAKKEPTAAEPVAEKAPAVEALEELAEAAVNEQDAASQEASAPDAEALAEPVVEAPVEASSEGAATVEETVVEEPGDATPEEGAQPDEGKSE